MFILTCNVRSCFMNRIYTHPLIHVNLFECLYSQNWRYLAKTFLWHPDDIIFLHRARGFLSTWISHTQLFILLPLRPLPHPLLYWPLLVARVGQVTNIVCYKAVHALLQILFARRPPWEQTIFSFDVALSDNPNTTERVLHEFMKWISWVVLSFAFSWNVKILIRCKVLRFLSVLGDSFLK